MIEELEIYESDKQTSLWFKLNKHYHAKLEMLRRKNDKPQSEIETAMLRGQISEINAFLNLSKELPEV